MMKKLFIAFLILFVASAYAKDDDKNKNKDKDKDTKLEQSIEKELRDELGGKDGILDLDSGKPGAHGRANAEYKKATNPGQGKGKDKNSSIGGAILDEVLDDDNHKNDKKNDKGDGKKKDGKNGK